ncbi:hypothetical protein CBOM_07647 [Ceraceosorus bombacis]|uniref:Uncharacterized protein n=1 Tax=Ceraceosorus bombacis TaxID=401625 RepID=A0A0P1BKL7_9BASI|nr:hypothetical protein CBOM_07647 [Ceraceosorus bombacis]
MRIKTGQRASPPNRTHLLRAHSVKLYNAGSVEILSRSTQSCAKSVASFATPAVLVMHPTLATFEHSC